MITIRIGQTTIETTPRQDAGLDLWGAVDNKEKGARQPRTGEELLVELLNAALNYTEQASATLEEQRIEKVKAILRDPAKADDFIAQIDAKAAEGK